MINHNPETRRKARVRKMLSINQSLPRLSVFRSNRHLWVQIIDDQKQKTLASSSTKKLGLKSGNKTEQAIELGKDIAKKALEAKIKEVRFDRGSYRYHGRVKALADSARKEGLKF